MLQVTSDAEQVESHYRVSTAAGLSGLSRSTIFRLIRDGRLKVKRIGTRITLIPKSELSKLLDGSNDKAA